MKSKDQTRHPLDALFNPTSVAMVGASASPEKMGGRRWKTLVEGGFKGPLYPINPAASEVRGHRAYKSIRDVPGQVDLAVVVVAPEHVPGIVQDCASIGVRAVVVITAGFGEVSETGKRLEQDMARVMRAAGGRLVGPNCSGIYSAPGKMNVGGWDVPPGRIGLISQSGNMALDFCHMARERGIGFSRYITIGNAVDVRTEDLVDYLLSDSDTDVVLAYIEGFGRDEGRRIYDLIRNHRTSKPIVFLKPGRSETGRSAALSHTGSLAGEDRVVAAALAQCGIYRATEVEEAWEVALALATTRPPRNKSVAVLTDGGGHATLFCDAAGMLGFAAPRPSPGAQQALRELLPPRCPLVNPIDFAGVAEADPEVIAKSLDICLADKTVGSAVVLGHFGGYHKIAGPVLAPLEEKAAHAMVEVAKLHGKPVIVHSVHGAHALPALQILRSGGVPVYRAIEMPAKVLNGLMQGTAPRAASEAPRRSPSTAPTAIQQHIENAFITEGIPWIAEPEARLALGAYGIKVPAFRTASSASECLTAVRAVGGDVAMKLVAPKAIHKTEVGAVALNVREKQAVETYEALITRLPEDPGQPHRVLITPMIRGGTELVCGAFRDAQFGPVIMVGLGGIHVELLKDVSFRLAPFGVDTARAMLAELDIAPLFQGYRGARPLAAEALIDILVRLSEMIADRPEIVEIDLNPVFVSSEATAIADVRIVLGSS